MIAAVLSFVALFVTRLVPGIAFQSVAVAAPVMLRDLHLNHAQIGLLLGAFMLPGIAVTVPAGMLARRIGDQRVLLGALALVALGAALGSQVTSFPALVASRVLAGLGGASLLMLLIKVTADRFTGPWLSTALATIIAAWPAGLALGLLVLGPVPAALGWRATIGLTAVPAVVAMLLVLLAGRGPRAATNTAGSEAAPLNMALVVAAVLSWSCINAVLATMVGFLPAFFVSLGRSVSAASAATSLVAWSFAVALPFGGLLADRLIGRRASVIGGCLATAAFLVVVASAGASTPALVGLGLVFAAVPGPVTAQFGEAIPPASRAVVFGWYSGGSYAAMTVAPWLAGWLRDVTHDPRSPVLLAAAFSVAALAPYAAMTRAAQARSRRLAGSL